MPATVSSAPSKEFFFVTYETILELTGYFASILILVSLLMSSAVKLRVINAIGAVVFTVYGILIHSYPTAFLNGVSVIVDVYYLVKLLRGNIQLAAHKVRHDDSGLGEFLRFYRSDIAHYFPNFDFTPTATDLIVHVYADANPVGLMIATVTSDGSLRVKLDYSTPRYRDCSIGKFLYAQLGQAGVRDLVVEHVTSDHEIYLNKMGFVKEAGNYILKLN